LISLAAVALRQVPNLGRYYRETTALLAGPRRFYRCIQCQQVGLERDLVDGGDNVGNALG
jgi:hypothetical protein